MKSIICTLALLLGMQLQAQVNNIENFKGRVTIPLKHGSDHPGKRTDEAMKRWRSHGLGQFIHWGVYSIPGGEWNGKTYTGAAEWIRVWREFPKVDYDNLYKQFNPTDFDAKNGLDRLKKWGLGM